MSMILVMYIVILVSQYYNMLKPMTLFGVDIYRKLIKSGRGS